MRPQKVNRALWGAATASLLVHVIICIVFISVRGDEKPFSCRHATSKVNYIRFSTSTSKHSSNFHHTTNAPSTKSKRTVTDSHSKAASYETHDLSIAPTLESSVSGEANTEIVAGPELITGSEYKPQYTKAALLMKVEGKVRFKVSINKQGEPENIELVERLGYGLDEAALATLKNFRFKAPLDKNGISHPAIIYHTFEFRLDS